ncbi:MAG: restriction endonuclease subunit S [Pseudanabaena sp.]|jgi:type I restriction enzyme S subunit
MGNRLKKNVPVLRFPEFKGSWKIATIEEIASISSGGTPSRAEPTYWNGDIPWITTSETSQSEIFDSLEKITQKGLENSSAKIFPKNTILMAMYGQGKTRGQVSLLRINAATSQNFAAITLKKGYSPDFVYCFLYQQYEHLRSLSNGNSHQNLSSGLIKSYEVPITSIAEQEKIASFLGALDTRLTQLRRKHELLQTYKRGVMQKIFSQQIRFPRFKDNWIYTALGKVTKYTKGFAFKSEDYLESGIRIIRASDLDSQKIRQENQKIYISQKLAENQKIKKYTIYKGNIIIATVGSKPELRSSAVGRGIYVDNDNEGLLNQNLLKFENIEGVNNRFLFAQINTSRYIDYISSIQRGNIINQILQLKIFSIIKYL